MEILIYTLGSATGWLVCANIRNGQTVLITPCLLMMGMNSCLSS